MKIRYNMETQKETTLVSCTISQISFIIHRCWGN